MTAYRFVAAKGLCSWSAYPYTGVAPGKCKPCKPVAFASGGAVVAKDGDEVSALAAGTHRSIVCVV
jgi:hypothetical protein